MATAAPRDPYEVLGVPRDADEQQVKKSFRALARELHPDVNGHDPAAEAKFKEAAEAYEILSDPERRAIYDRYGHEGLRTGGMRPNFEGFGSLSDLFSAFFGAGFAGAGGGPMQGDDAIVGVEVTLSEAFTGVSREVSFEAVDRCATCGGDGAEPGTELRSCERCGGTGTLQAVANSPFGQVMQTVACDSCAGRGRIPESPCEACDGQGRVVGHRELEVEVPAGIDDGQRIRLAGHGHAGEAGAPDGDLYVQVAVDSPEGLVRDGNDLVAVIDLPAPRASLGATEEIESVDGAVEVEVPSGTQPGEVITVRHRGMPQLRRPERRGDLRVVVNVVVPRGLDREQVELTERLAGSLRPENLDQGEGLGGKLRRLFGGGR